MARAVNQILVDRTLRGEVIDSGAQTLWTFSPITYGLEHAAERLIYHSVDLLHVQDGLPSRVLLEAEQRITQKADVLIASSRVISDHLRKLSGRDVLLWENVAETELFAASPGQERLPRAIFAGNLSPMKVNFSLLRAIADTGISLALAGPTTIDGTSGRQLRHLLNMSNVNYLGSLKPQDLAREVRRSSVGIIPYHLNDLTNGIFPMKTFEYLAAGLAVISTDLVSLRDHAIDGLAVSSDDAFAATVAAAIAEFDDTSAMQRAASAMHNSWTARIASANQLLNWPTLDQHRHK